MLQLGQAPEASGLPAQFGVLQVKLGCEESGETRL